MQNDKRRIAVGLSGGVDSAVAAALLKRAGYEVLAVTMQLGSGRISFDDKKCSACFGPGQAQEIDAARAAAAYLEIPHAVIPLADEFEDKVLGYYRREYLAGRTPNPCVVCNALIKFGALREAAAKTGFNCGLLATGHYARVDYDARQRLFLLRQGIDPAKDQSYFLHRLNQAQLAAIVFPLGDRLKRDVIAEAKRIGLPRVTEKKESRDFLQKDDHSFLFAGHPGRPGPILDTKGKRIGTHRGIIHYTIGQRSGLGGGAGRRYVKEIRAKNNTIVIGERNEILALQTSVRDINWIAKKPPAKEFAGLARLRYRQAGVHCQVTTENSGARVVFDEPQFAVTPGQAAVFYRGDEVLGGGWIVIP
ncbi:MAG: tRNA 2-thiouridine(34) synthase MnmA [Kiritimatiellae bacterium]|jgi:tRNA-specific 2-thiouridylase|nr:tRNA 2-thiouridine(34) synthase MnmA [Kiritimatiellia bacterium]